MPTDLEIANGATLEPIEAIAWKLGISSTEINPIGKSVAKITWDALKSRSKKPQGSLVLVTSVNPTPFGEGKTVTTIKQAAIAILQQYKTPLHYKKITKIVLLHNRADPSLAISPSISP